MLVLTRMLDEEIKIGDNITVKVTKIRGTRVQLGITAPMGMRIDRPKLTGQQKLMQRIKRNSN